MTSLSLNPVTTIGVVLEKSLKICSKCGKKKRLNKFIKDSSKIDGLYSSCKDCNKERQVEYSKLTKSQKKLYDEGYRKKNDASIKVRKVVWHKENRKRIKGNLLEKKYGISLQDWEKMWKDQKGLCGWCGTKMKKSGRSGRSCATDHSHNPPYNVRMLVHSWCNINKIPPFEKDFESSVLRIFNYPFTEEEKLRTFNKLKEKFDGLISTNQRQPDDIPNNIV